ncbi:hypothetical protein ABZP36_019651 [Zizania latifolia]
MLDVLLAERIVDEADRITADAKQKQILTTADILALKRAISDNRQKLADQLAEATCQSSTRGIELRASASALKRLGHSLLLSAHNQRLQCNMPTMHPSSTSYSGEYTASLAQQVFSVIAQACSDSIERHALASCAAAGGLRAAAECVQIALGHSSLLEARGLTFSCSDEVMKQFRPSVEQALESNLTRIKESTAAFAAVDDWVLTYPPSGIRTFARSYASNSVLQQKLSSSAHHFNSMVQDFFEDVGPLHSLQLGDSIMDRLLKIFSSYVNLLISALPGSLDDEANL